MDTKVEPIKKRGPGRPTTKKPPPPVARFGIQPNPSNTEYPDSIVLEYKETNPMSFKKMFELVKKTKATSLFIYATDTRWGFYINIQDKSFITININASKSIYYFNRNVNLFKRLNIEQFTVFAGLINNSQDEIHFTLVHIERSNNYLLDIKNIKKETESANTSTITCLDDPLDEERIKARKYIDASIAQEVTGILTFDQTGESIKSTLSVIKRPYNIIVEKMLASQLKIKYGDQLFDLGKDSTINLNTTQDIISVSLNGKEILTFAEAVADSKNEHKIKLAINKSPDPASAYTIEMKYSIDFLNLYFIGNSITSM
jgi:hypothetical protein